MGRRKPSIRIKKIKDGFEIIKTFYDEFGKAIKKQTDAIIK